MLINAADRGHHGSFNKRATTQQNQVEWMNNRGDGGGGGGGGVPGR